MLCCDILGALGDLCGSCCSISGRFALSPPSGLWILVGRPPGAYEPGYDTYLILFDPFPFTGEVA